MFDLPDFALIGSPDYPARTDDTQPCHWDSCYERLPQDDPPECNDCKLTFCREHLTDFGGDLLCGECLLGAIADGSADAEQAPSLLTPQPVARRMALHAAAGCSIEEMQAALGGGR
ncbi:MAG TPA: hypothetical protein VN737_04315 [Bryobacteraceae bacterium]|nr:hypothetical protein [Bryobacteraceae bacterium]